MTNINCTSNCIYQKDGKCNYELINTSKISSTSDCAYFIKKRILKFLSGESLKEILTNPHNYLLQKNYLQGDFFLEYKK